MQEITLKNVKDLLESGALEFMATQEAVCLPILQRIYKKMKIGIAFEGIKVKGSKIVDGHHRYICSELSKIEITKYNWEIASDIGDCNWSEVIIREYDYETPERIHEHNIKDAKLNNVDISVLNDL